MLDYNKVIFVSKTDTGRGPLAAQIMKEKLGVYGDDITSRGLVVLFPAPMNPKFVAIAKSKGIDMSGLNSVQLTNEDFGPKVLVLTMDEKHKTQVYDDYADALNVYTIREFIGDDGDIVNPHSGDLAEYGSTYEELSQVIELVIKKLQDIEE